MGLSVIDVEPLRGVGAGGAQVVDEIAAAAADPGFFHIVGHDIDDELVARVWEDTRGFFALPCERKLAVSRTKANSRGYYDRELTKNRRDLKEVFDFAQVPHPDLPHDDPCNFAPVDGHNQWPDDLPGFQATMMEYLNRCEALSLLLLGAFARALEIPGESLARHFGPANTGFVRLNHYPTADLLAPGDEAAALGNMALHHHSDAGALTVLLQDGVGGLQVERSGAWIDVDPLPGALVVNTGDIMQVWSNDRFRAPLHRVRPLDGRERYSIPFFFNPSYDCTYEPLVAESPRYRPINWGEFRQLRADGDYADYGHEVQIADYAIQPV